MYFSRKKVSRGELGRYFGKIMCHKTTYFLGGYYLIKLRPMRLRKDPVFTCSTCINDGFLGFWSYSWTTGNNDTIGEIKDEFLLDDQKIQSIRTWVDHAFDDKRIGWCDLFYDLETADEYSQTFFSHIPDKQIASVYFSEQETAALFSEFKPQKEGLDPIGLFGSLQKKVPESLSNTETFIGFDIIGIEISGDFHSFWCHDLAKDLTERFHLTLNQYGLFEDSPDWKAVTDYMNAEETGCEPVPWFVCKVKLVN